MRYVHVSVDLIVLPKFREEVVEHNGQEYVVPIEDGFQTVATPKSEHRTYLKPQPKFFVGRAEPGNTRADLVTRVSKKKIKQMTRRGNSWGAEWYQDQRAQAEKTRAQQKAAKERA